MTKGHVTRGCRDHAFENSCSYHTSDTSKYDINVAQYHFVHIVTWIITSRCAENSISISKIDFNPKDLALNTMKRRMIQYKIYDDFANHSIFQYVRRDFRFYVYQENRVIGSQHVPNKETKLRGSVKSHIKFMMYKVSIEGVRRVYYHHFYEGISV